MAEEENPIEEYLQIPNAILWRLTKFLTSKNVQIKNDIINIISRVPQNTEIN